MKGTCIYEGVFMKRIIQNPKSKIRNPKSEEFQSKIPNPNFLAGFWILDFGPLCTSSSCEAPAGPDFGFWIFDFGCWIWGFGF